eukprot:2297815-Rhodomonas_salina.3
MAEEDNTPFEQDAVGAQRRDSCLDSCEGSDFGPCTHRTVKPEFLSTRSATAPLARTRRRAGC